MVALCQVAVVGGGPAGLMAAEVLAQGGARVTVYDAMTTLGRKILLAGKGGLNLTHAEPMEAFLDRYGARRPYLQPLLTAFGAHELRQWAQALGIATFVGSSGRVFPTDMKAAPLLRAWLHRLREYGVEFRTRHRWTGWDEDGALLFTTPQGQQRVCVDACVLALGGGSWSKLGSDGAWVSLLAQRDVTVAPLQPANCGFDVGWSEHFRQRYAGQPVKSVVLSFTDVDGVEQRRAGEFIITDSGVEGSLIYAVSAGLRAAIAARGAVTIRLDLAPDRTLERLLADLSRPRAGRSWSNHLRKAGIDGVKAGLLREALAAAAMAEPARVAAAIKSLPLGLSAPRPLDEAISSAGGVVFEALDRHLMLRALPGVFCAGEMLDWEAPTGGYLLTACLSSGRAAGQGVLAWLSERNRSVSWERGYPGLHTDESCFSADYADSHRLLLRL